MLSMYHLTTLAGLRLRICRLADLQYLALAAADGILA